MDQPDGSLGRLVDLYVASGDQPICYFTHWYKNYQVFLKLGCPVTCLSGNYVQIEITVKPIFTDNICEHIHKTYDWIDEYHQKMQFMT